MYHDAHAHLQIGENSDEKIKQYENMCKNQLSGQIICNATSEQDFEEIELLSKKFEGQVIPSYGIHPWFIDNCTEGWLERLKLRLQNDKSALIGEIGLDKKRKYGNRQKEIFESQLKLVLELRRPASIHCVKCHGTMFDILKKILYINDATSTKKLKHVLVDNLPPLLLHGWSGSFDMSKMYVRNFPNIYYSFSLPLRKKSLEGIPISRVLAETDDQDPVKIQMVYKELAIFYKKSNAEMINIVNKNFKDCFQSTSNINRKIATTTKCIANCTDASRKKHFLSTIAILIALNVIFSHHK